MHFSLGMNYVCTAELEAVGNPKGPFFPTDKKLAFVLDSNIINFSPLAILYIKL